MPGFDDTFRMNTNNKQFVDVFSEAIQGKEKKTGSVSVDQQGDSFNVKVVGDLFYGDSESHANSMTRLLKACIEKVSDVSFNAHYDLHCYSCADEAKVDYTYSQPSLMVIGDFVNDSGDDYEQEYCDDLRFAVTGSLEFFENSEELLAFIEENGGTITESVSSETDYLICSDPNSTSSKVLKAKELGIPIISEEMFIRKFADPFEFCLPDVPNEKKVNTYIYKDGKWDN